MNETEHTQKNHSVFKEAVDCFKPIYQSCSIFVTPQRVSYSFPNNGCLTLPCQVAWCSWQNSLFAPFTNRRMEYQIRWRAKKRRKKKNTKFVDGHLRDFSLFKFKGKDERKFFIFQFPVRVAFQKSAKRKNIDDAVVCFFLSSSNLARLSTVYICLPLVKPLVSLYHLFLLFPPFNISRHSLCDTGREKHLERKRIEMFFIFSFFFSFFVIWRWRRSYSMRVRPSMTHSDIYFLLFLFFIFLFLFFIESFLPSPVYTSCVTLAKQHPAVLSNETFQRKTEQKMKERKKKCLKIHRTISFAHYFTDFVLQDCKLLATFVEHAKHKSISFEVSRVLRCLISVSKVTTWKFAYWADTIIGIQRKQNEFPFLQFDGHLNIFCSRINLIKSVVECFWFFKFVKVKYKYHFI